ncbi:hypothetical protein [Microterricola pindariensis]|uniref:hypothetical protein n=1 Tax=Microterricola pindariensis TaxID=478010 RepID=UPI001374D69F|nr:hypothetical protein [Microterricola pindariensis]
MSDPHAPDTSVNDPAEGVPEPPADPMTTPSVEQPEDPKPDEEKKESIRLDPIGDDQP